MRAHSKPRGSGIAKSGFDFDKAFVRYALAGSAIVGMPIAASAQAPYPDPATLPLTITTNGAASLPVTLPVSFDGSATDFTLEASLEGPYPFISAAPGSGVSFLGSGNYPTAFPSVDAVLGSASGPTTTGGTLAGMFPVKVGPQTFVTEPVGAWPAGPSDAFLGVSFQISGQPYIGWADIAASYTFSPQSGPADDLTEATATLSGLGYQQVAPEPGSIALLALGASGLALLRKRRKSAH